MVEPINSHFGEKADFNSGDPTKRFTLERVVDEETLEKEWFPLLQEVFPDPGDQEPLEMLKERLALKNQNYFALLRDNETGKAMGIRLMQTDKELGPFMYVPWGGVTEQYRNGQVYPMLVSKTLEEMKKQGIEVAIHECEDLGRVKNLIDSLGIDPNGEEAKALPKQLNGRINFFRREMGSSFVDDPDIKYVRPASDDEQAIQAYDLLALTPVDPNSQVFQNMFNEDRTAISKEGYRKAYLITNLLQYPAEGKSLEEKGENLRKMYPAVDQFMTQIENSPKQWFNIKQGHVAPRSAPPTFQAEVTGSLENN